MYNKKLGGVKAERKGVGNSCGEDNASLCEVQQGG